MIRATRALGALLCLVLLGSGFPLLASPHEGTPLLLRAERQDAEIWHIRATGSKGLAAHGRWRWRSDGGDWRERWADPGSPLTLSAPGQWLEVELEVESEAAPRSARSVFWSEPPPARAQRGPALRHASKRAGTLSGRALYRDRKFDLSGYTGMGRLPIRMQHLELRRASDDSLLSRIPTDGAGQFSFPLSFSGPSDLRIDLLSTIEEPGLSLRLRDQSNQELRITLAQLVGVDPDSTTQLGEILLLDAEAPNILDVALDFVDFLADPAHLGAPPDSGSVPLLRYDPSSGSSQTEYDGSEITISSTGSGDSDGWSDCLILAALAQWAMQQFGAIDQWGALSPLDLPVDVRRAFGDGAAMALAAAVRQHRASTRFDADTKPVDADIHAFVDLPTAPPLGIPVAAEWAFDLERRQLDGAPLAPFGQLGAFNVASMLHDMWDAPSTSDDLSGDDELLAGDSGRAFQTAILDLGPLAGAEWIRFELAHDAWLQRYGDAAELESIAVATGRTALFDDAAEPDDGPEIATVLPMWIQPALTPAATLRLSEIFLGADDAVELFNPSEQALDISGYRIVSARNGFSDIPARATTLPAGTTIGPGRFLMVREGSGPARTATDVHDPAWSVPWRHDEDGACTLENALGAAIDFVRWSGNGGMDPSATPVPVGTAFAGVLVAPQTEPRTLARNSVGDDLDQALDFQVRNPTPRAPNVQGNPVRSIRPYDELDWFSFSSQGSDRIVQLHAFAPRDAAMPRLAEVDSSGATLSAGFALGGEAWMELAVPATSTRFVRLAQDAGARASAGWDLLAWQPYVDLSLLAVENLSAQSQQIDPALDDVLVQWSNVGSYGALRIDVDGFEQLTVSGQVESAWLQIPTGRHLLTVTPTLGSVDGASSTASVYVGSTACEVSTGFDTLPEIEVVEYSGFTATATGYLSINALRDGIDGLPYPNDDFATATVVEPIDLTADSRLSFIHHCHVLDDGDRAAVEISVDDGASWTELARYGASDHVGGGDPADWSDGILQPGDWVEEEIALDAFAGQRARLRFLRVSNSSGNSLGWAIDRVRFGSAHDGVWMDPQGSDLFGCGHPDRPFLSAAAAWDAVAVGDTLHLASGVHVTPSSVLFEGQMRSVLLPLRPHAAVAGGDSVILDATGLDFALLSEGIPGDSLHAQDLSVVAAPVAVRSDGGFLSLRNLDLRGFSSGLDLRGGRVEMERCIIAQGADAMLISGGELWLSQCTIAEVATAIEASSAAVSIGAERSIFAHASGPFVRVVAPAQPFSSFVCNDFWDSPSPFENTVDWIGLAGNVDLPVYFCNLYAGDFHLGPAAPQLDLLACGAVGALGVGCQTPVASDEASPMSALWLRAAPNPFNPRSSIDFSLAEAGFCELSIFDVRGRRLRTLLSGRLGSGKHRSVWDGRDDQGDAVASGVYRLLLRAGSRRVTLPLVLIR